MRTSCFVNVGPNPSMRRSGPLPHILSSSVDRGQTKISNNAYSEQRGWRVFPKGPPREGPPRGPCSALPPDQIVRYWKKAASRYEQNNKEKRGKPAAEIQDKFRNNDVHRSAVTHHSPTTSTPGDLARPGHSRRAITTILPSFGG
jgi:hypothetical protein